MITINVNGRDYSVEVAPDTPLVWVIRDVLKLTGTKFGCGIGECGSCTVLVNGKAERSCLMSVKDAVGAKIITIEGLAETHPVKLAWIEEQVVQCGYCQPGIMLQTASLLQDSPNPDPEKIIGAMDNVICRCGTYPRIKKGIQKAVEIMKNERRPL